MFKYKKNIILYNFYQVYLGTKYFNDVLQYKQNWKLANKEGFMYYLSLYNKQLLCLEWKNKKQEELDFSVWLGFLLLWTSKKVGDFFGCVGGEMCSALV